MPRLLLINPSSRRDTFLFPPLGLDALAAHTPSSWQIDAIDENLDTWDPCDHTPDLVAMGAFTVQATRALTLAQGFRARGVQVVLGGIHASVEPQACLKHVDSVVVGEGEFVWPQVLADAEADSLAPIYEATAGDMSALRAPARRYFGDRYRAFGVVEATRGCPFSCDFCSIGGFRQGRFRHKDMGAVIEEIASLRQRVFTFVDDNFAGYSQAHREWSLELCRQMIRRGLRKTWFALSSVQIYQDPELLRSMRDAGCAAVFLGFEHVGRRGGARLKKTFVDRCDPMEVAQTIADAGLGIWGSFILGQDEQREEDLLALEDFVLRSPLHFISLHHYTALPGTGVYRRAREEGRLLYEDPWEHWDHCDFTHHTLRYRHFSAEALDRHIDRIQRRFYAPHRVACRLRRLEQRLRPSGLERGLMWYGYCKEWMEARRERRGRVLAARAGRANDLRLDPRVRRLRRMRRRWWV